MYVHDSVVNAPWTNWNIREKGFTISLLAASVPNLECARFIQRTNEAIMIVHDERKKIVAEIISDEWKNETKLKWMLFLLAKPLIGFSNGKLGRLLLMKKVYPA